jgi:hypothetical protein
MFATYPKSPSTGPELNDVEMVLASSMVWSEIHGIMVQICTFKFQVVYS